VGVSGMPARSLRAVKGIVKSTPKVSDFQMRVYTLCSSIPMGKVRALNITCLDVTQLLGLQSCCNETDCAVAIHDFCSHA
jgi:hypothetical protein